MEDVTILVLDKNFFATYTVSEFSSFIWTDRYWGYGSFELETVYLQDLFDNLKVGNYLFISESDTIMVVESVSIGYDAADRSNQFLTFKGRSIISMLDRRVIWGAWSIREDQPVQTSLFNLLSANAVYPSDKDRKLSVFSLSLNAADKELNDIYVSASGYADGLYEVIQAICESEGIGFKAIYRDGASTCPIYFYLGKDRSYDQDELPPVIFSAGFENLGNTRYTINTQEYKTLAYAYGPEDEVEIKDEETGDVIEVIKDRTVMVVGARSLTGLDRREMSVSAGSSYPNDIQQSAMEKIAKVDTLETLDSELDAKRQFVYGRDFFMGDIVQIVTEFGLDARARVTEFTRSWAPEGYTEVPTFEIVDEKTKTKTVMTVNVSRSVNGG